MTQREFRKKSFIILGLTVLLLICMVWDTTAFRHSSGESSSAATKTTKTASSVSTGSALVTDVQAVWIFWRLQGGWLVQQVTVRISDQCEQVFQKAQEGRYQHYLFPCGSM